MPTSELRVETVALATLFPSPSNPRHNDDAVEHVAASIRRFGFQQPLVAKRSGEVIAGNTRWKAAKALGLAEVPVVWFDGSELDATAFAIADNRTHEFAEWDEPALARLLQQLREEDALDGVGYDDAEIDRLIAELDTAVDDVGDDEAVEPPETPTTRRGDLWILGGHRLLCGDSTSADDVARLMAGEKASLLATDPPYLVDYQGGNHPQSSVNRARSTGPTSRTSTGTTMSTRRPASSSSRASCASPCSTASSACRSTSGTRRGGRRSSRRPGRLTAFSFTRRSSGRRRVAC